MTNAAGAGSASKRKGSTGATKAPGQFSKRVEERYDAIVREIAARTDVSPEDCARVMREIGLQHTLSSVDNIVFTDPDLVKEFGADSLGVMIHVADGTIAE